MTFRRKLFAVFTLTVVVSVGAVTWIVSSVTRRAFERVDEERAAGLTAQFQNEFQRRGQDVAHQIETITATDSVNRMALAMSQPESNPGEFVNLASNIAADQHLNFLEFIDSQGTIISSAQWPAKSGYKQSGFHPSKSRVAFLQEEDTPEGAAIALSAIREITVGDKLLYVIGGRRIDKDFLGSLELPAGSRAFFYSNLAIDFTPALLIDPSNTLSQPERLASLVQQVQQQHQERAALIRWTSNSMEDETVHAIPLAGQDRPVLGILLVGNSRRSYEGLRRHIGSAALVAAIAGILLAVFFSRWAANRVTLPVEQLAEAAREVGRGHWDSQVSVTSNDEFAELADAFNRMTREITEQRNQLVQTERVAAWRELARRLAHELKNPLFPLQLTVENLVRARQRGPQQFEEIFQESSSTLLAEIANLKAIISRFSEFSRMPQPNFQRVDLNELLRNVARLFQAQLNLPDHAVITCKLALDESLNRIAADPELLHRAFSNLVLNAMDAMPQGGTLTLSSKQRDGNALIEIADTGGGLTSEERERLFTPYYTSKANGTGLGLAIVQSVISDHGGKITVQSQPGHGTTFMIELPGNRDKLPSGGTNVAAES